MRVVVVGDVAHVVVDVVLELEVHGDHLCEAGMHVIEVGGRRFGPVGAPHDPMRGASPKVGDLAGQRRESASLTWVTPAHYHDASYHIGQPRSLHP